MVWFTISIAVLSYNFPCLSTGIGKKVSFTRAHLQLCEKVGRGMEGHITWSRDCLHNVLVASLEFDFEPKIVCEKKQLFSIGYRSPASNARLCQHHSNS